MSLRIQQLDVVIETKTRDNVFVHVTVSVQYHVDPALIFDAFYKLTDPRRQIESFVLDVIRAEVPKMIPLPGGGYSGRTVFSTQGERGTLLGCPPCCIPYRLSSQFRLR